MTRRWRWSRGGRAAAGRSSVFDALETVAVGREGRDRRGRRAVRRARADRACHHGGALSAPPAARRPPGRGGGIRRAAGSARSGGRSRLALCRRRLAADRRSALGSGWRATSGWSASTTSASELPSLAALAETAARAAPAPPPAARAIGARRHPDRRAARSRRIEPEIRALRAAIVAAVERHIAQLPPPDAGHPTLIAKRAPVRFAGSWSVRLAGAGFHANHIHPAGWLSSAFYVALPEGDGRRDHAGWLKLGEPQAELGLDLPPIRHDRAEAGPAGALSLDHVARHRSLRRGRAADRRVRRRPAALTGDMAQPPASLAPALELLRRGDLAGARARGRGGAGGAAGRAELLAFAGLLAAQAGDPGGAIPISAGRSRRARRYADAAQPRHRLARHRRAGRSGRGLRRRAATIRRLLRIAAYVHQQQGRLAEAAAAYEAVIDGLSRTISRAGTISATSAPRWATPTARSTPSSARSRFGPTWSRWSSTCPTRSADGRAARGAARR